MLLGNTIEYTHLIGSGQSQKCVTKFLAPSPLVAHKHALLVLVWLVCDKNSDFTHCNATPTHAEMKELSLVD